MYVDGEEVANADRYGKGTASFERNISPTIEKTSRKWFFTQDLVHAPEPDTWYDMPRGSAVVYTSLCTARFVAPEVPINGACTVNRSKTIDMYHFMVFFEVDGFGVSVMQDLNYLVNCGIK